MTSGKELGAFVATCIISSLISGIITMFFFYYLRKYIDKKSDAAEVEKTEHEALRKRKFIAEADWRQKVGRYLFWLYQGVKKPPPNGDLDDAKTNFEDAEAEIKRLEREELADHYIKEN